MQYADPDVEPMPINIEVEIRDKDSVLVYGPRDLTYQDQKSMVLFWNGRDNYGELVDLEQGPYECKLTVYYREAGTRILWGCSKRNFLKPTGVEILEISFLNDNQIYKNSEDHDGWGAGSAIQDPVWKDNGGTNNPICYNKDLPLSLKVKLKFSGPSVIPEGKLKLDGPAGLDCEKEIEPPPSGGIVEIPMSTTGKLKNTVYWIQPYLSKFNWFYTIDGVNIILPQTIEHRIYVTYNTPDQSDKTIDNKTGENKLTERRLEELTLSSMNATTSTQVAEGAYVMAEQMGDFGVTDAWPTGTPPIWLVFTGIPGSCIAHANLMWHAISLEGLQGAAIRVWPSSDNNYDTREFYNDNPLLPLKYSPDMTGDHPNNYEGACYVNNRYYPGMVLVPAIPGLDSKEKVLEYVAAWQAYWDITEGRWFDLDGDGEIPPDDMDDIVKFPWEE